MINIRKLESELWKAAEDDEITFSDVKFNNEDGFYNWNISFDKNGMKGKYKISAYDGRILTSYLQ